MQRLAQSELLRTGLGRYGEPTERGLLLEEIIDTLYRQFPSGRGPTDGRYPNELKLSPMVRKRRDPGIQRQLDRTLLVQDRLLRLMLVAVGVAFGSAILLSRGPNSATRGVLVACFFFGLAAAFGLYLIWLRAALKYRRALRIFRSAFSLRLIAFPFRVRDRILALGLALEVAALLDIFLVRWAQRPLGGLLLTAGAALITIHLALRALAQSRRAGSSWWMYRSITAGALCGAITLIQLLFTLIAAGSPTLRSFFLGPAMIVLVGLILALLMADSFSESRSTGRRR